MDKPILQATIKKPWGAVQLLDSEADDLLAKIVILGYTSLYNKLDSNIASANNKKLLSRISYSCIL